MKKDNIYDALSGIDEKYLEQAEDFKEISAQFRRSKIHKAERYVSLAACLAVTVIAGLNIYDKNGMMQQESIISPAHQSEYSVTQPVTTELSISTEEKAESVTAVITDITENTAVTVLKTDTYQTTVKTAEKPDGYINTGTAAAIDKTTAVTNKPAAEVSVTAVTKITRKTTAKPVTGKPETEVSVTAVTNVTLKTTAKPVTVNTQTEGTKPEIPPPAVPVQTTVITNTGTPHDPQIPEAGAAPGAASPGVKVPDKWEDMRIYQKFDHVVWENMGYMIYGKIRGSDGVGEKLGDITAVGYDSDKDETHYTDAEVFRIDKADDNRYIAVRFNGFPEFYMYRSIIYF